MSILIVEDNAVNARMLEVTLQKHGYRTARARTGREALDRLQQDGPEIEMVITDIMMPEMDGLELFAAIRAEPKWQMLPVVIASAAADAERVAKAAELGCHDYILKPIHTAQLLGKVRSIIMGRKPALRDQTEVLASLAPEPSLLYRHFVRLFTLEAKSLLGRLSKVSSFEAALAVVDEAVELAEAAKLVGAERLTFMLDQLCDRKSLDRLDDSDVSELRSELKLALNALSSPA
jgi:CheY-like chemotaxis protein